MSRSTAVGHLVGFLVIMEVFKNFVNSLSGLVRLDPMELASRSEGIPSSHFKVSVPPFGLSSATLNGLQG
eukprot:6467441-Amphidinium_carterae.2